MIMSFKAVTERPTVVSHQITDLQQTKCLFRDDEHSELLMLNSMEYDGDVAHGEYF